MNITFTVTADTFVIQYILLKSYSDDFVTPPIKWRTCRMVHYIVNEWLIHPKHMLDTMRVAAIFCISLQSSSKSVLFEYEEFNGISLIHFFFYLKI